MRGTLVVLTSVALTGDAFAFQIETIVTPGCHESITLAARREAAYPDVAQAPAPTEDQRRASHDLTFTLPAGEGDLWTMTILIGVRSNDIKDYELADPALLIEIHDNPAEQHFHCLRRLEDDYAAGDAAALAACRGFILDELEAGGFFVDTVDMTASEDVHTFLGFRQDITLALPRFAYHLGRAIHALEDGYAHALRNPTTGAVRHVVNWIDVSDGDDSYNVARDGYQHLAPIDDCTRDTSVERYHVAQAQAAVVDLLGALRDPSGGGSERRARVEAALDRAFAQELGCDETNRYCDAGEPSEQPAGCSASPGAGLAIGLVLLGLIGRRRGRAGRRRAGLLALLIAGPASAEEVKAPTTNARTSAFIWHADLRFGGALDHAALAVTAGAGVDYDRWTVGLLGEWNPWFSLDSGRTRTGALNIYGTLARRWYDGEHFTLYSRIELGTSTILFELVGVDQYATGVYFGGTLFGASIKRGERLRVTLDPSHFAMPTPRLTGLPFYWRQYRVTIGLEYRFE